MEVTAILTGFVSSYFFKRLSKMKSNFIFLLSFVMLMEICFGQNYKQVTLSLTEKIAHSTVRLKVINKDKVITGSSFIYYFKINDTINVPALVTNKHVILGGETGRFLLTEADQNGYPNFKSHITIEFDNFENRWIFHPDKNVDLAIMSIAPILEEAKKRGKTLFYRYIDDKIIPTKQQLEELTAVEDILMVGYPIGFYDEVNNYPIFRKGITATHPNLNYNDQDEFLIDAACFPGSSGSPVFLLNTGSFINKEGGTSLGQRFYFLGVFSKGFEYPAKGKMEIIEIPNTLDTLYKTNIPTNLGKVIKSYKIEEFLPILKAMLNTN